MYEDRIRNHNLKNKIVSADQAAGLIKDGMIIGMSGFTRAGDVKEVPLAMAKRAKRDPFQITLITGASLGHDVHKYYVMRILQSVACPFKWIQPCVRLLIAARSCLLINIYQKLLRNYAQIRSAALITPLLKPWQLPKMEA